MNNSIIKIGTSLLGLYVMYKFLHINFANKKNTIEKSYSKKPYTLITKGSINKKSIIILAHTKHIKRCLKTIKQKMKNENITYISTTNLPGDQVEYYKAHIKINKSYEKYKGLHDWFISIKDIK